MKGQQKTLSNPPVYIIRRVKRICKFYEFSEKFSDLILIKNWIIYQKNEIIYSSMSRKNEHYTLTDIHLHNYAYPMSLNEFGLFLSNFLITLNDIKLLITSFH